MNAFSKVQAPGWTVRELSELFGQLPADRFDKQGLAITARAGLDVLADLERVDTHADPKSRTRGTIALWSYALINLEYPELPDDDPWGSPEYEAALNNWDAYVAEGVDPVSNPSNYLASLADRHGIPLPSWSDADSTTGQTLPPLQLLSLDDDDDTPELAWTVSGMIQAHSLCAMVGAPGEGKTSVALAIALHVAAGRQFVGRDALQGAVIYVAAEGHAGALKSRIRAMRAEYGMDATPPVHLVNTAVNLLRPVEVDNLLASIASVGAVQPIRAVIFDTLPQCMAGADENGAKDMGQAISSLARVRDATGAAVIVLTHPARGGTAPRGSSALTGALDTQIGVVASQKGQAITAVTLHVAKQRNAPAVGPVRFNMRDTGSALVPVYVAAAPIEEAEEPRDKLSAKAKVVLAYLQQNGPTTDAVWRATIGPRLTDSTDPASQRKAFNRAKAELESGGVIAQEGGMWRVAAPPNGTE